MKKLSVLLGVSLFAFGQPCLAWMEYPPTVASTWQLKQEPSCTICHTSNLGGKGTATKPFALSLEEQGLGTDLDPALLSSLLSQAQACEVDSDGDGTSDYVEIANLTNGVQENADPNDGNGAPTSQCGDVFDGPLPRTGCAFAPVDGGHAYGWLAGVAAMVLALRRNQRKNG